MSIIEFQIFPIWKQHSYMQNLSIFLLKSNLEQILLSGHI